MKIYKQIINHETLTKEEAKNVLVNISMGSYNSSQIVSFLTVYMMKCHYRRTSRISRGTFRTVPSVLICRHTIQLTYANWWRRKRHFQYLSLFVAAGAE
jgi:hypothetical protein